MPPENNQQKKSTASFQSLFTQIDEVLSSTVSAEEVADTVKTIFKALKAVDDKLNESVAQNKGELESQLDVLRQRLDTIAGSLSDSIAQSSDSHTQTLSTSISELRDLVESVRKQIPTLPDYSGTFDEIKALIPSLPDPLLGEDMRNALEALPEGDKLSIDAIEGLRKELKDLRKMTREGGGGGGVASSRNLFQDYDLSPYLDGVTKTFNLPATWNIITVDTSSFPHALRKTIDYTWTPQSITFTSEIDAATTLATGQTVIITLVTG